MLPEVREVAEVMEVAVVAEVIVVSEPPVVVLNVEPVVVLNSVSVSDDSSLRKHAPRKVSPSSKRTRMAAVCRLGRCGFSRVGLGGIVGEFAVGALGEVRAQVGVGLRGVVRDLLLVVQPALVVVVVLRRACRARQE